MTLSGTAGYCTQVNLKQGCVYRSFVNSCLAEHVCPIPASPWLHLQLVFPRSINEACSSSPRASPRQFLSHIRQFTGCCRAKIILPWTVSSTSVSTFQGLRHINFPAAWHGGAIPWCTRPGLPTAVSTSDATLWNTCGSRAQPTGKHTCRSAWFWWNGAGGRAVCARHDTPAWLCAHWRARRTDTDRRKCQHWGNVHAIRRHPRNGGSICGYHPRPRRRTGGWRQERRSCACSVFVWHAPRMRCGHVWFWKHSNGGFILGALAMLGQLCSRGRLPCTIELAHHGQELAARPKHIHAMGLNVPSQRLLCGNRHTWMLHCLMVGPR